MLSLHHNKKNAYFALQLHLYKKNLKIKILVLIGFLICGIILNVFTIETKLLYTIIEYIFIDIINIMLIFLVAGLIIGINFIKYNDYRELLFLYGLPITKKDIAIVKLNLFIVDFSIPFVALFLLVLPLEIAHVYLIKLLILTCSSFISLLLGMDIAFLLMKLTRKIIPYIIILFIMAIILINNSKLYLIVTSKLLTLLFVSGFFLFLIYKLSIFILHNHLDVVINTNEDISDFNRLKYHNMSPKKLHGVTFSIIYKDYLHYKREARTWLQMLTFDAIIIFSIIYLSKTADILALKIIIFTIPFGVAGQIALYSFGSDGTIIEYIYIACGSLKKYYLIRLILAFLFTSIPIICMNIILYFIVPNLFTNYYFIKIFFVTIINVILAVGISVCFIDRDITSNKYNNGTKINGMILYYILGMGIPIVLAFNSYNEIPIYFIVYALINFLCSLYYGIKAYIKVNKIMII